MITGQHYLAGEKHASGGASFTSHNPRTKEMGQVKFYEATPEEINQAVQAGAEAFQITKSYPAAKLADFLEMVAAEIEALGDELLNTADWETGLGLVRLTGERGRTTGQLRAFAGCLREGSYVEAIIDTALPDRQPAPRPDIRRMLVPLGVVGVFSASNFPFAFATAGGDTASAWAAGCPVIVKGHPSHPATSELFALAIYRAIEKTGFPKGFFSLIQGASVAVGQTLVQHPLLDAVGFTGSLRGGRALFDTAAARPRPIPVYAEMGSINPVIILPRALAVRSQAIAEGFVNSLTLGSGQFCTNPGLVFLVNSPESQTFIQRVSHLLQPKEAGVLLNDKIQSGLAHIVAQTTAKPSVTKIAESGADGDGYRFPNTLLQTTAAAFRADVDLQTEHFGPVSLVVLCDSAEDLRQTLPVLHGNLTTTIHGEADETDLATDLLGILQDKVGRILWNGFPTGVEVVYAQQHGGPYPATTAPNTTSVGITALKRFLRPVAYQNLPDVLLPEALKDANPLGIWRTVNQNFTREGVNR